MKKDEALKLLGVHSGRNLNNELNWEDGFLGSIRKFNTKLIKKNFLSLMECLKIVSEEFEKEKLDRNLMADLYGVFYQVNLWLSNGTLKGLSEEKGNNIPEL